SRPPLSPASLEQFLRTQAIQQYSMVKTLSCLSCCLVAVALRPSPALKMLAATSASPAPSAWTWRPAGWRDARPTSRRSWCPMRTSSLPSTPAVAASSAMSSSVAASP
uniref:Secreted protein n=1 Tax=Macrostomum lignano TaxID=282301 RepID=A0A1I8HXE0_9PLAT